MDTPSHDFAQSRITDIIGMGGAFFDTVAASGTLRIYCLKDGWTIHPACAKIDSSNARKDGR
jgi:hypothetical protein